MDIKIIKPGLTIIDGKYIIANNNDVDMEVIAAICKVIKRTIKEKFNNEAIPLMDFLKIGAYENIVASFPYLFFQLVLKIFLKI